MALQPENIIRCKGRHPLGLFSTRLAEHQGVTPVCINDIERTEGEELPKKNRLSQHNLFLMKLKAMRPHDTNVS